MPDLGHVAVGLAAGRAYAGARVNEPGGLRAAAAFSALALLPDLDLVGRLFGVPALAPWGHRGAAHSVLAALFVAAAAVPLCRALRLPVRRAALFVLCVVASHGALDMLDTGALGVACLWPLSASRFFWPLRFLPGPPPGEHWLTFAGARAVLWGVVPFLPLFAWALRPRRS